VQCAVSGDARQLAVHRGFVALLVGSSSTSTTTITMLRRARLRGERCDDAEPTDGSLVSGFPLSLQRQSISGYRDR
jgi:hypothetical protein